MTGNYIALWDEENQNYYDLDSMLNDRGPRSFRLFGHGIKNGLVFGNDFTLTFYLTQREMRRLAKGGYAFFMDKRKYRSFLRTLQRLSREMHEHMNTLIAAPLKRLSGEELWDLNDAYGTKLEELFTAYGLAAATDVKLLEEKLITELKKRDYDLSSALSVLTAPSVRFIPKKNSTFFRSFDELLKKETAKISPRVIDDTVFILRKEDQKPRERLLKRLNLPAEVIYITEVLRTLAAERLRVRIIFMKALYYSELFLIELKRRHSIPKKELRRYSVEDLKNLMLCGKKVSVGNIAARNTTVKLLRGSKITTFHGKKAVRFLRKVTAEAPHVSELQGLVASVGYAVGKAVIFSYKKTGEHSEKTRIMNEGDILITGMTKPNIIAACEKAGAIVTDEGGVLSHAAIVSREFGVPCVLGTIHATEVFKDGDYVEVDARKGVVRKLTRDEYLWKKEQSTPMRMPGKKARAEERMNPRSNEQILWLKDVRREDLPSVGGKGANLGELITFSSVPNGFCVTVNAYEQHLSRHALKSRISRILKNIDCTDESELNKASGHIKKLILSKPLSGELKRGIGKAYKELNFVKVAVRSSATAEDLPGASFAGQQDTYLNVSGTEQLLTAVRRCWASLFTPRAIYYREKQGFKHEDVLSAVVIQEMVDSRFAGVMFTKDPIHKRNIMIEAIRGLGEKLVSGEITPSSYTFGHERFNLIEKKQRFPIPISKLRLLAKEGKRIENHFKSAQDIEWAIDKTGRLFILQTRPITA